jgi:low temperature requirement protein LtrA
MVFLKGLPLTLLTREPRSIHPLVPPVTLSVLRDRGDERAADVTNMELFFDLVFVFAFTQISSHLYNDVTWLRAAEAGVMFLALWWAWNYTAWATGWIDPEQTPVMLLLACLMLLSLVMAASVPDAFPEHGGSDRAPAFALAYVLLQTLRSGFMVWTFRRADDTVMARNYAQLVTWSAIAGVVWIAGAFVTHDNDVRVLIWLGAAAIDVAAPMHGFWLPRRGSTPISEWSLAGGHLAERCQLLLMIAFGEIVLRLGESFTEARERPNVDLAFVLAFVTIFALWSIYFNHHADRSVKRLHLAEDDAARIGRSGYAYAHMVMVGGVIVLAVATHMAVEFPRDPVTWPFALVGVGGPGLYLLGLVWSKRALGEERIAPPLIGCGVLALAALAMSPLDRFAELCAALVVAVVLAVLAERDGRRLQLS